MLRCQIFADYAVLLQLLNSLLLVEGCKYNIDVYLISCTSTWHSVTVIIIAISLKSSWYCLVAVWLCLLNVSYLLGVSNNGENTMYIISMTACKCLSKWCLIAWLSCTLAQFEFLLFKCKLLIGGCIKEGRVSIVGVSKGREWWENIIELLGLCFLFLFGFSCWVHYLLGVNNM